MNIKFILPIVLVLQSFVLHKYYVSVTEIYLKKNSAEIIIRTFPDDMERAIKELYQIKPDDKQFQKYLYLYINEHFQLATDNKAIEYQILGTTQEDSFLIILIKANLPKKYKTFQIKNNILTDIYDDQKNIVHFILPDNKTSFILNRQDFIAEFKK